MSTPSTTSVEQRPAHHHHAMDTGPAPQGATGARGVLIPVAIVLVIGSIFVSVFLAAFHAPRPHHLPVGVVGATQQVEQVTGGLELGLPGGFEVKRYPDEDAARRALQGRKVYAAYITTPGKSAELMYAGANGPSVTSTVTGAFSAVAKANGDRLTVRDVVPASEGDTRAMSVFYAGFGVVLAGFLFGMMTYQMAPRLEYRWRLASLAAFSVLAGVLVAAMAGSPGFAALPGPFLGIAGIISLMAAAVGSATMVFMRFFGRAGMSLAAVVLLTFGNSTSGGTLPAAYLPGWLHPFSEILPVGVGVRAVQGLSHFDHDGLTAGITVLLVWIVVGAALLYWRDARGARRAAVG
ncbi:ABC transporter permease [Streptomyces sp. NPDC020951]|uniref:ABC transporter permease n=1 Tax=Streptomyces sp. NPDC020951 TaxID=3365104 RepID=UPI00378BF978